MIKSLLTLVILTLSLLLSSLVHAQDIDNKNPYQLVADLGNQLFTAVNVAKQENRNSPEEMETLVDELLMPYIDVPFASYKILGTHFKKTSKQQKIDFINVMKLELKKTYSSALAQYKDQSIRYQKVKKVGAKKLIAVKTTLLSPNSPDVNMTFKLRRNKKTGEWKAYDLVVEGISLIESKRAELAKPLRDKGVIHVTNLFLNKN